MTTPRLADNTRNDDTCHRCAATQRESHQPRPRRRGISLSPGHDDRTLAPVDDADLLARIVDGDRRALEVLYERHAGWLLVRLERRCGDCDLADLALQDTFLSVWRSAGGWRNEGQVAAWIWGIAIRRLIDLMRKAKRRPLTTRLEQDQHHPGTDHSRQLAHVSPTPEETIVDSSLSGEMSDALSALPVGLLDVMIATSVDGLTNRETAVLLGIPLGTVKTRARRARQLLKEALR